MMMWFYIFGTLLICFFLLKNIHNNSEYKKYSQNAIAVFDDTRKSHRLFRILFSISFVIALILIPISLFIWHIQNPDTILSLICLTVGSALFAFYPFTPGRWVLTAQGIYIYNNGIFIPWAQIIGTQIIPRGKKTFIIVNLKQTDGENLKRTSYPILVPGTKAQDVCNLIRDFVNMLERKKHRKQFNQERSVPLKDRRFY